MARRVSITVTNPPGFQYAPVFADVVRLLALSFSTLGYEPAINCRPFDINALNVVLNYQALESPQTLRNAVVYQLEPLTHSDSRYQPSWLEKLRYAREIWDYNQANVEFLRTCGFSNVKYLPLGYHPALRTIPESDHQPIDVLFYGSRSSRRFEIISALTRRCRLRVLWMVWGAQRDQWIAQSKILLNLHLFEGQPFECVRVRYLLNNARFVISENSMDNPYTDMVVASDYDRLVETTLDFLNRPDDRRQIAQSGHDAFARQPMVENLRRVL